MDTTQTILATMQKAGKPLKTGEIAELSGIDKKDIEKAIKDLQKTGEIVSPKRCYWEPK